MFLSCITTRRHGTYEQRLYRFSFDSRVIYRSIPSFNNKVAQRFVPVFSKGRLSNTHNRYVSHNFKPLKYLLTSPGLSVIITSGLNSTSPNSSLKSMTVGQ